MDKYNSKIARFLAWLNHENQMAVTISATCTLYSRSEAYVLLHPGWIAHEQYHQESIADRQRRKGKVYGWIDWMTTYLWRGCTTGYRNMEEEVKAREAAKIKVHAFTQGKAQDKDK